MQLLGVDIGSSSVKVSVLDADTGRCHATAFSPQNEMSIKVPEPGWAEQDPEDWYSNMRIALQDCLASDSVVAAEIRSIGIAYQMHGLVIVDKAMNVIRPSIIWCDSRAVNIGDIANTGIGPDYCRDRLLNSPGNFTASKLAWIKANEPENYNKIYKIMLPGDYIAMRLSGEINTTISGLSEGIFWDFVSRSQSEKLLDFHGFDSELLPELVDTFSIQGKLSANAAEELGLSTDVVISYRAGDQPNNAFSLNVLDPGEVAATAGTSGVIYGVSDRAVPDPLSRVNMFAHVNYSPDDMRLGVLACINGTGIMNAWVKRLTGIDSYSSMNSLSESVKPGCDGLQIFPFGNGAERLFGNKDMGASFNNINLNIHGPGHIYRAVQESIAFSFRYAMDIMRDMGMEISVLKAGDTNMFISPLFRSLVANLGNASVNLYNTDGSIGAARGAGIGNGYYSSFEYAFTNLDIVSETLPDDEQAILYNELYQKWKENLSTKI